MKQSTVSKTWLLTAVTGLSVATLANVQAQDAAAAPEPEAKPKWVSSAGVGLTITGGNSDTIMFTGDVKSEKKWNQHEIFLGADATYGENDGIKSTEVYHGFGQYNWLFPNDRTYGYFKVDALKDDIADIDYRFTFSPGIGHYLIKNDKTSLSVEAGPGYIMERVGGEEDDYMTLRLAERFEHKFSDKARVWQSVEIMPQVDDFDNYIINAEIGAEAALTTKFSIRSVLSGTYDNVPAPGRKEEDYKLITSLVYKF